MHVLCVIDSLIPSGAERSLATLAPHYVSRGVVLDVVYLHDGPGLQAEFAASGANLFCIAGPGGRLGWLRRARGLVVERRPDLIHTTLFESDIAGRIAGALSRVPIVSSLVGVPYGPEDEGNPGLVPWKVRAANSLDAATAHLVSRFHAVSEHVADVMSLRLRLSRDRVDVVPRGRNPVELGRRTRSRGDRVRAGLGLGADASLILAAARQEREKGLDVLLEVFPSVLHEVPNATLVVAGREGNQTALLRAAASRLGVGDAVRFLGQRDDVPDLLSAADVFVLPSRREGCPGVLLEAMALEAPIVATQLPPVKEVLGGDEIARFASPDSPQALARAIVETLRDREGAARRARLGRIRFLQEFDATSVAVRMLAFYARALAGSDRRVPPPG